MAYATVTLTGTYQTPDGTPHKGHVEIIPSERVIKDTTGNVILTGRVKVDLDAQGAFSVVLPATDDVTLNPTGFGYTIAAKLHSSHPPAVSFSLPAALGATTVEDLTPVDPSTFAPTTTYAESSTVTALDARVTTVETDKANSADLATVATTGNYTDLAGQPSIPSTAADVGALPDTTTPADLGAEPAGLSQTTNDTLDATYASDARTRLRDRLLQISLPVTSDASLARVNANLYRLSQRLVGNKWFRVDLLNITNNPGNLPLHQLNVSAIDMPWLSVDHTDASVVKTGAGWAAGDTSNTGTYGGSYTQNNAGVGDDVTWTTPAATRVGMRTVAATNAGIHKVEIDGDTNLANLLPTAQDLVNSGQLTATALVGNGGTLNPTDRVLDLHPQATGIGATIDYDRHIAFADGLPETPHTVKVSLTGYQNVSSGGYRLYISGFTYATPTTTIATPGADMLAHTRLLSQLNSAYEYAHMIQPTGAGSAVFVGNVHGYDAQTSLTFYLDGELVALADGDRVTGNDLSVVRVSELRHPDTGATKHADVTTTYRLGIAGLQITHDTTWATDCNVDRSYPAMFPLNGSQFPKGSIGSGADYDLTGNDGTYHGSDKSDVIYAWQPTGTFAALLHMPDLAASVNDWAASQDIYAAIEDRVPNNVNAGDLSKMYVTRIGPPAPAEVVTAGTRWRSHAIYRVWQQVGVDRVLASA